MNALGLYLLGRRLARLGETALRGTTTEGTPASIILILQDVGAHQPTSISDVTVRTGLPQSYVSTTVTRLTQKGVTLTSADPGDGRRTLVRLSPAFARRAASRGMMPIEAVIAAAAGTDDPRRLADIVDRLERLARDLRSAPVVPGQASRGDRPRTRVRVRVRRS